MKTQFSETEISRIIREMYPQAENIYGITGGLVSQTYCFTSRNTTYVFQISRDLEGYRKENYVDKSFSNYINVKNILKIDMLPDNSCYCISKYINARRLHDLAPGEIKENIHTIIKTLESLEKINISTDSGFGYFDSRGNAPYKTWADFICSVQNDTIYHWDIRNDSVNELVKKCCGEIQKYSYVLDDKKALIHGDFGSYNVLAGAGDIYLIDWNLGLYGDPLYEISNILFWNEKCLCDLINAIQKKYIADEAAKTKNYIYELRVGLEEIYRTYIKNEPGFNTDWIIGRVNEILENWKQGLP